MYRKIVLALDGSEGSDRALGYAVQLARRDDACVIVAHATTHGLETKIEEKLQGEVAELSPPGSTRGSRPRLH